jgi:sec-independent protein translocase protein TatA
LAFDEPIVWVLIVVVVVFLFGAGQIPKFAKSIGQARREFSNAMISTPTTTNATVESAAAPSSPSSTDPLLEAARKEGIDTQGRSRQEIASELSLKLNNKSISY